MMSNQLAFKTIEELAHLIKSKECSPVEVTDEILDRAEALNPRVNAYISIDREKAEQAAKQAEAEIVSGHERGPLHGIPFALKDMFAFEDRVRTMASNVHSTHPEGYEATVVNKLKEAGAIITGTLNMIEYAFGNSFNPRFGICRNPWNLSHFTGGSSSGSGAAVSADMVIASLGSDTGGSIRIPAAWCGVVGLKPTYGRVSKYGAYPLSWSYDHVGPITKSVADAALVLEAIAGYDVNDPTTIDVPVPNYSHLLTEDIRGLVIGINEDYYFHNIDPDVEALVRKGIEDLVSMGAVVKPVDLPYIEQAHFAEVVTVHSEAATIHRENLNNHSDELGDVLRYNLLLGHLISGSDYTMAQQVRRKIRDSFNNAFQTVDVLISPTTPVTAATIEQRKAMESDSGVPNFKSRGLRLTSPSNAVGLPSMSIPCGFVNGLPVGMQLIGKPFYEGDLFRIGYAYEKSHPMQIKPNVEP